MCPRIRQNQRALLAHVHYRRAELNLINGQGMIGHRLRCAATASPAMSSVVRWLQNGASKRPGR